MAKALPPERYIPSKRDRAARETHYDDFEMQQELPAIYQLLTEAKVNGEPRPGSKLTIFCRDGDLKISIWDEYTGQCWFATLPDGRDILAAVDKLLQAGKGEWRESKRPPAAKPVW